MKLEAADRDKRDGLMAEISENSCPLQSKVNKGDRDALGGMTFFDRFVYLCKLGALSSLDTSIRLRTLSFIRRGVLQ